MVTWQEFADGAPGLAVLGEERFERPGLVLIGTVRRDGTPRISPVEPLFLDGRLYLGMMWRSKKALDLLRDPRVLVHSVVTNREGTEGEFKLRGQAVDVQDPAARERYADALYRKIDFRPEEPYHLFTVDIESAAFVVFEEEKIRVERWPLDRSTGGEVG